MLLISQYRRSREKAKGLVGLTPDLSAREAGCPSVQYSLGNRIYQYKDNTKNTNKHFLFYYSSSTVWNPLFIPFSIP